jgi:hypothetical protein
MANDLYKHNSQHYEVTIGSLLCSVVNLTLNNIATGAVQSVGDATLRLSKKVLQSPTCSSIG